MEVGLNILIGGRSPEEIEQLEKTLADVPGLHIEKCLLNGENADPLGCTGRPDLLLLLVSGRWQEELAALSSRPSSERPPVVVIGKQREAAVMRAAMRAGARDFFTHPVEPAEFADILQEISVDKHTARPNGEPELTAVIGARGGAGTSMVSSNLAHILSRGFGMRTALVDLDIQFGTLPLLFDLQQSDGLLEALSRVESLDEVAIEGYMLKHGSGLHILGSAPDQVVGPGELDESRLLQLTALLKKSYRHVVVDLPRQIDNITGALTSAAKRVIVVVQPNIPHIKDTRQLLHMLTAMMGVPPENIIIAANRCDRNSAISKPELEKLFASQMLVCLSNDFATVSESQNIGRPIYDLNPRSPLLRDLISLAEEAAGTVMPERERRTARRLFGLLG